MRRFAFAALLAAPLALAAIAAPAAAQSSGAPFTGLHIDGIAGWNDIHNHGHGDGVVYGIGAGYDMALGNGLRAGIEGEVDDSNNKSCFGARTADDPRYCAKTGRDLYIGGRIGQVVAGGRGLIYVKAGYTNARVRLTENDGDGPYTLAHKDLDGARLGVGGEYGLTRNTYLKAEYRYSNYEQGFSSNQIVGGFGVHF